MASFVVFVDTPTSTATSAPPQGVVTSRATSVPLAPTAEKENINPATGEFSRVEITSKKRKTAILSTKAVAPLGYKAKGSKEPKESKPAAKKRKGSSSVPTVETKVTKATEPTKKGGKTTRTTRKQPALPKVDEDEEATKDRASQQEARRLSQVDIDARIYELTVLPLADVTKAYGQAKSSHLLSDDDKSKGGLKPKHVVIELRDDSSPTLGDIEFPIKARHMSVPPSTPRAIRVFTTPERRELIAAFTFTAPSPSADRFIKARAASAPLEPFKPVKVNKLKSRRGNTVC